jgi:hypothetical protein
LRGQQDHTKIFALEHIKSPNGEFFCGDVVLSICIYRVSQNPLKDFARLYLRNPWDYRNGVGAKRCVLSLSFVWKFKNIDYLKISLSYGQYTKKSVFAFFCASEIVVCLYFDDCD